ncbi:MAG: hypothetical protein IPK79_10075 [Vampirovibrionales bacterium]|nr:hypothetical protein [Vampirovibrionales bacterium]
MAAPQSIPPSISDPGYTAASRAPSLGVVADAPRHSRLGMLSLGIGCLAANTGLLTFMLVVMLLMVKESGWALFFAIVCLPSAFSLTLLGLGLGVWSLFRPRQRLGFKIAAVSLSGLNLAGIGVIALTLLALGVSWNAAESKATQDDAASTEDAYGYI